MSEKTSSEGPRDNEQEKKEQKKKEQITKFFRKLNERELLTLDEFFGDAGLHGALRSYIRRKINRDAFLSDYGVSDIVQSANTRLLDKYKSSDSAAQEAYEIVALWRELLRIAYNRMKNHWRHEEVVIRGDVRKRGDNKHDGTSIAQTRKDKQPSLDQVAYDSRRAKSMTPDEEAAWRELDAIIKKQLTTRQSEILEFRLEGMLYKEIAEEIGVSERTIEREIYAIREIFRSINDV